MISTTPCFPSKFLNSDDWKEDFGKVASARSKKDSAFGYSPMFEYTDAMLLYEAEVGGPRGLTRGATWRRAGGERFFKDYSGQAGTGMVQLTGGRAG